MLLQSLITLVPVSSSTGCKSPAQLVWFHHTTSHFLITNRFSAAPLSWSDSWTHQSCGGCSKSSVWQTVYIGDSRVYIIMEFLFPFHFIERLSACFWSNLVMLLTFGYGTILPESSLLSELCCKNMSSTVSSSICLLTTVEFDGCLFNLLVFIWVSWIFILNSYS